MKVRYIGPGGAEYCGKVLKTGDVVEDPSGLLCKKAPRTFEEVKEKPKAKAKEAAATEEHSK